MSRVVSLEELLQAARAIQGRINAIYLHWTAGHYDTVHDNYHINITGDGQIHLTGSLTDYKPHTFQRNTGAIGLSLCCAYNMHSNGFGDLSQQGSAPPTHQQVEIAAKVVAALTVGLDLLITPQTVMTHCEAAELDGYGPSTTCERWDLWYLVDYDGICKGGGDVIRGKANWYREQGVC